jgi:hypothetical protein
MLKSVYRESATCGTQRLAATALLGLLLSGASSCRTPVSPYPVAVRGESIVFTTAGDTLVTGIVTNRLDRNGAWASDEIWEGYIR